MRVAHRDTKTGIFTTWIPSSSDEESEQQKICIREDSEQVDGIGGVVWDGALLMNTYILEQFLPSLQPTTSSTVHILELGCGCGLTSLMLAGMRGDNVEIKITATDRIVDLVTENAAARKELKRDFAILPLTWGNEDDVARILTERGQPDIIIGCEIIVLVKQHSALLKTIHALAHPGTVVFMSADGAESALPAHQFISSRYELSFVQEMQRGGYAFNTVAFGTVSWEHEGKSQTGSLEWRNLPTEVLVTGSLAGSATAAAAAAATTATVESKEIASACAESKGLRLPRLPTMPAESKHAGAKDDDSKSEKQREPPPLPPLTLLSSSASASLDTHHVTLFYPRRVLSTCQYCHSPFLGSSLLSNALNPPTGCYFHSCFFACREVRRDRALTEDERMATYWDCCGLTDFGAKGCLVRRHVGY